MRYRTLCFATVMACLFLSVSAERITEVDATLDAVGAMDSNPFVTGTRIQIPEPIFTYAFFPSLTLGSTGESSNVELSYTFGVNRFDSGQNLDFESHDFTGRINADLSPRWRLYLSDTFRKSPDLSQTRVLTGAFFTPEGMVLDYESVAFRRDGLTNAAESRIEYKASSASSLEFRLGHGIRNYEKLPVQAYRLSNQSQLNAQVLYIRTVSDRTSWDVGYSFTNSLFDFYEDSISHSTTVGISHNLSPEIVLRVAGGPSYTESLETSRNYTGFSAAIAVSKQLDENRFSLAYRRRNGATTGIGSISDVQTVTFDFARTLGQRITLGMNLGFIDSKRQLDNPYDLRGFSANLILGFRLFENVLINIGGSVLNQEEDETRIADMGYDLDRNRVFVSLRFVMPRFIRTE